MDKFKRRHFLLGGVAAGTAATLGTEYVRRERAEARQAAIDTYAAEFYDPEDIIQAAVTGDTRMVEEFQAIQAAAVFPPPPVPYSREISKRLILLSRLATQQYITGRNDPNYDGNLQQLLDYDPSLDKYRLVANFRGKERQVNDDIEIQVPQAIIDDPTLVNDPTALEESMAQTEEAIRTGVTAAVTVGRKVEVFYGFLLESDDDSILVFRGTQRTAEWIGNIYAVQQPYPDPTTGESLGNIHAGFRRIADSIINPLAVDAVKQINPTKPCYVSGHSLGAALATVLAMDIAVAVPDLQPQLQVYVYASPRVGNPEFARSYAERLPNSFRITNLADPIPTMPPTKLRAEFVHVGEEWAFVSQAGDILPNHIVDTYRRAVNAEAESNQTRNFPITGIA
ncbi:lipase [Nodosilinea sp. LEGE 07088]|uniref:lipase family protein n=1 Tax=Nodosilinea sp. LEGE 07088 TaxID=2777968 RepID=UPI001881B31D|nr:lipase [Nodosilinea sp. LEGE 07088]MBE9140937.1 lipase [Nodosilinea sp. LEGE 07088]